MKPKRGSAITYALSYFKSQFRANLVTRSSDVPVYEDVRPIVIKNSAFVIVFITYLHLLYRKINNNL